MKNLNKIIFSFLMIFLLIPVSLSAVEFGVVTNITGGITGSEPDFKIDIWPRLFTLIGDNAEFVFTTGFTLELLDEELFFVPELLHTEFSKRLTGGMGIRLGRFNYSDPLSFIMEGLFDGALFYHNSPLGSFKLGAWYTGLLYKNNTVIAMTDNELENNSKPVDIDDFFNSYFAPQRFISSFGWEHPSLGNFMHLNTALIAQFDLNDESVKYNSQYFIVKSRIPTGSFIIELGTSIEAKQNSESNSNLAFAGEAGLQYVLPGKFNNRLSFSGKYASGSTDDGLVDAFVPITVKYYGFILKQKMSGLSVFTLDYSSRLHQTLGASVTASYFARNESETSGGNLLGPEFCVRLIWSPFIDLQFNLGGGIFVPSLGDAAPEDDIQWRLELTAKLAL